MRWIRNILREVFGLFVDDGRFALVVLVWLGIARLLPPHLGIMQKMQGICLFAGLGIILIESKIRYSYSKDRRFSNGEAGEKCRTT